MMRFLTYQPIDAEVQSPLPAGGESGAIVTFVGTPRRHSRGKEVMALEYQAYEEMAAMMLAQIIREAQLRWSLETVLLKHRLGRVSVGEASIVIHVLSPHRSEAFRACEFIIQELKHRAPIWKKELYTDGTSQWVECEEMVHDYVS